MPIAKSIAPSPGQTENEDPTHRLWNIAPNVKAPDRIPRHLNTRSHEMKEGENLGVIKVKC